MRAWPDYILLGEWYGRASLEQLRPGSQYMVQVSSLNQEGYSKFSPVTFFTTPIQGKITYLTFLIITVFCYREFPERSNF